MSGSLKARCPHCSRVLEFAAGTAAIGGAFADFLMFGWYGDEYRRGIGTGRGSQSTAAQLAASPAGRSGDHRTVTPAGGGWDAPGTGYERLNTAISLVEPERTPDELGWHLEEIRDILARHEEIMKRRESPPLRLSGG